MTAVLEKVIIDLLGVTNRIVFRLTRGSVVPYRFHGVSGLLLTVIGPCTSNGYPAMVPYLPDGDGYIVFADRADPPPGWETDLLAAGPADSVTVELDGRSFDVVVERLGPAAPARLLGRLPINQRHEVRTGCLVPLVRLAEPVSPGRAGEAGRTRS